MDERSLRFPWELHAITLDPAHKSFELQAKPELIYLRLTAGSISSTKASKLEALKGRSRSASAERMRGQSAAAATISASGTHSRPASSSSSSFMQRLESQSQKGPPPGSRRIPSELEQLGGPSRVMGHSVSASSGAAAPNQGRAATASRKLFAGDTKGELPSSQRPTFDPHPASSRPHPSAVAPQQHSTHRFALAAPRTSSGGGSSRQQDAPPQRLTQQQHEAAVAAQYHSMAELLHGRQAPADAPAYSGLHSQRQVGACAYSIMYTRICSIL